MTYVLASLFWTVAGLVVGYWLGAAGREASEVPAVVEPDAPKPAWWRRHLLGTRLFGVLLVTLAVLSVLTGAVFVQRQAELVERQSALVECQNAYNRAVADWREATIEAGEREREGQRRLLDASFAPRERRDPAEIVAAYRQYRELLAQADAQRDANPFPVPTC